MRYKRQEVEELALNQLNKEQIDLAVKAFSGFVELFGQKWVNDIFRDGNLKMPSLVVYISLLWEAWSVIRDLDRSNKIVARWKKGLRAEGIIQEVLFFAELKKAGVELELFTEIDGSVPDCVFKAESDEPVYVEISSRGLSDIANKVRERSYKLSEQIRKKSKGRHGKIGIKRHISDSEWTELLEWVKDLSQKNEPVYFKDFAVFHTTAIETGGADPNDTSFQFVPKPKTFSVSFKSEKGNILEKATTVMHVSDTAAQQLLESESKQLPKDKCRVIVLDISNVVDGLEEWKPLILRRFQPSINTRISAVVLMSKAFSKEGMNVKSDLLVNPHAKISLGQKSRKIFETSLSKLNSANS